MVNGPPRFAVRSGAGGKAREIEPVIDEMDLSRRVGERAQIVEVGARAGDAPRGVGELSAKLPFRRRPDVLGVRRERPAHAADQRRVARDRCRRVEVMRVDPVDVGRQLARQHAGLAEAPAPVDRRIALQVGAKRLQRLRDSPAAPPPISAPARTRAGSSFRYSGR